MGDELKEDPTLWTLCPACDLSCKCTECRRQLQLAVQADRVDNPHLYGDPPLASATASADAAAAAAQAAAQAAAAASAAVAARRSSTGRTRVPTARAAAAAAAEPNYQQLGQAHAQAQFMQQQMLLAVEQEEQQQLAAQQAAQQWQDGHVQFCPGCDDPPYAGSMLECSHCPRIFHAGCCSPYSAAVPVSVALWRCPYCVGDGDGSLPPPEFRQVSAQVSYMYPTYTIQCTTHVLFIHALYIHVLHVLVLYLHVLYIPCTTNVLYIHSPYLRVYTYRIYIYSSLC
jgi:PHD-finger